MNSKIKSFCGGPLDSKVIASVSELASNDNVRGVTCHPDIYQKEHTIWPSGITVKTNGIILPDLLEGIGCGISVFRLSPYESFDHSQLGAIVETIAKAVRDADLIRESSGVFNDSDSLLRLEYYLHKVGITNLQEIWRNDTFSRIRFPNLDDETLAEYIDWPPKDMGFPFIEGNHFIELQEVENVYDSQTLEALGISHRDVLLMLHMESEGLNISVEKQFKKKHEGNIEYPSSTADEYLSLSNLCQRYCLMNRVVVARAIQDVLHQKGLLDGNLEFVFETTHCGLFERDGLIYHHTGASLALPPGDNMLDGVARETGQPLILPGALGIESYILTASNGTANSDFTVNHGLGRRISKKYARSHYREEDVRSTFKYPDLLIHQVSGMDLVSQMSTCYKDIGEVLSIMQYNDFARKAAKLKPLGCIKG
jgi:RNA-splicing ligase RtcB